MSTTTHAADLSHTPDYDAIKAKQQATWQSGDYGRIGVTLQITGESLCEAMDLRAGSTVLDVAAGNGNATLAAARRFCKVVSTDYVEPLLNDARQRANAEGLSIDFQVADAEQLPFTDSAFDNVISTFGIMFAPNQEQVASELVRVCKPGGKIGLANWTPESFIGQLFKTIGQFVPPPTGVRSPAIWGTTDFINTQFESTTKRELSHKDFVFRYHSPQHWVDVFATYYGPTLKAFEAVGKERNEELRSAILALIDKHNVSGDSTMTVPSQYAEIVIER